MNDELIRHTQSHRRTDYAVSLMRPNDTATFLAYRRTVYSSTYACGVNDNANNDSLTASCGNDTTAGDI